MSKKDLIVKKEADIATLYINRPEKKNAFHYDMWREFPDILEELENDDAVKVLIIRGVDETAFVAGADISEFDTLRSTAEGEQAYNEAVLKAESALMSFTKPVISMIQKYCIGGGCILALACDLRFSSEDGTFGITPAKLGIVYTFSSTKNLVDLVGPSRARDILFSGRIVKAKEAYQYGLVDHLYSNDEIEEKTYEYAKILTKRSQRTIKGSKKVINEIMNGLTEPSEEISQLVDGSYASADYQEGVRAFLEKRDPQFTEK